MPPVADDALLTGSLLIAGRAERGDGAAFHGIDPTSNRPLESTFHEASSEQVRDAVAAADLAFREFSTVPAQKRAEFLRAIAAELVSAGAPLLERARSETGLPLARLEGERGRTVHQLHLMADVLDEGSWVEARIDAGDELRTPIAKPDIRRLLVPLGPVAVFAASNFPFAYSIAGGDTASAFAAGCTVVCKAHPAHPGTSELTARAVFRAIERCGLPSGVFSMVHGWSHEVGITLVKDARIQAVGFTGSLRGGRAIFDAAAARSAPIPVYAEMGSINPVFLLPSAVRERSVQILNGLVGSMTQGVGQFCTNPGVIVGVRDDAFLSLTRSLAERVAATENGVMLYEGLFRNFTKGVQSAIDHGALRLAEAAPSDLPTRAQQTLLAVDAEEFIAQAGLREEMFGPASIVVTASTTADLERVAEAMEGQLTASLHGTAEELAQHANLVQLLQRKVGRLIFNGYPTGVEVGHAIVHGGPYPASTDVRTTAVGSAAITRFARPVCFQNFPQSALPEELHDVNHRNIWRLVNGAFTKDDVQ
ncbi:MAG: aldehyde dehydrogenase (NADP(+)) [Phycisphaerae bacterium]|nr:aldehyde dehydrogenase (NADP(+)) [Gemmatimonadaceae bacterium]